MSPFERLLNLLPPDQRVGAALDFEKLSADPHSPIYTFYTIILQAMDAKFEERLATTDTKVQQLAAQQAKGQAENLKAVRQEVEALNGKTLWRRIIASRFIGATIWVAVVCGLSNYYLETKIRTVDPEFHKQLEAVHLKIGEQIQLDKTNFEKLANNHKKTVDYIESVSKTTVTTARETLIGKGLSYYVESINDKTITLMVGERRITMQHYLTPTEYLQLSIAKKVAESK